MREGIITSKKKTPYSNMTRMCTKGERQEYVYKAEKFFRDPLTGQIHEGVRINKSLEDTNCKLMNSKSEFRQGVVPRIEIKIGLNSH